ncbi:MAG: hypothetical protein AB7S26_02555 [Sandaracinaceae bacterium]
MRSARAGWLGSMRAIEPPILGVTLVVGLVPGCYEHHVRPVEVEGTRLLVVEVVTEDGERQPDGFFDQRLGIDCAFVRTAEDAWRCLPRDMLSVVYEDDACARPVAFIGAVPCGDLAWSVGCDGVATIYDVGEVRDVEATYVRDGAGGCTRASDDQRVADVELADLREYASATAIPITPGDGPTARWLRTDDDGMLTVGEVVDRRRNVRCFIDALDDRTAACVASSATSLSGCEGVDVVLPYCPVSPGAPVLDRGESVCRDDDAHLEVTGPAEEGALVAAGCSVPSGSTPVSVRPLPFESERRLTERRLGSGRLRALAYETVEGELLRTSPVFWDSARNERCSPREIAGVLRCVPSLSLSAGFDWVADTGWINVFTDPRCEQTAALRADDVAPCPPPDGRSYGVETRACGVVDEVFVPGERVTQVFRLEGSRCVAAPDIAEAWIREPVDFAPLTRVRHP